MKIKTEQLEEQKTRKSRLQMLLNNPFVGSLVFKHKELAQMDLFIGVLTLNEYHEIHKAFINIKKRRKVKK